MGGETSPLDVGPDVEVAKEDEHEDHVARQQVLAPLGELTAHTQGVDGVGACDDKLDLMK